MSPILTMRRWWPFLALWLIAYGFMTLLWGHGIVRALLLLAVAALALFCLRATSPAERRPARFWLAVIVALLALTHPAYLVARQTDGKVNHLSDIATTTVAAAESLVRGENPYTANIDHAGVQAVGPTYGGYKYLPVTPLLFAPLGLTLGDNGVLLTNLALDFLVAALIFFIGRRGGGDQAGLIAAGAYLSLPLVPQILSKGVADLAPVALLLASLLLIDRRPFAAGLLFGLSVSAKPLPALAALPACIPSQGRIAFALGVSAGLLPTAFAFLASPRALFDNIVVFNLIRPADETSWTAWLAPQVRPVVHVAFGAAWLALAAVSLRKASDVRTRASFITLSLTMLLLTGPAIRQNYCLWWIPFIAVATALRVVADNPRPATAIAALGAAPVETLGGSSLS